MRGREDWQNRDRLGPRSNGVGFVAEAKTPTPAVGTVNPNVIDFKHHPPFVDPLALTNHLLQDILTEMTQQDAVGVAYEVAVGVSLSTWVRTPFAQPLFAITLTNDGIVAVNFQIPFANAIYGTLNPSEVRNFAATKAVFVDVGLRLAPGVTGTPTVRVTGLW